MPTKGASPPNISPHPSSRKPRDETAKTMKFLDRMLTVFLARAKPASTAANPRFIKNTKIAARNTHRVSVTEYVIFIPPRMKMSLSPRMRSSPAVAEAHQADKIRGRRRSSEHLRPL